jgi:hypothetical protein
MINIIEEFGRNAGKIWETLCSQGPQTEKKLMSTTGLKTHEFYAAVGWLARENKICKIDMTYQIGDTNMTEQIGQNAGKIFTMLETMKEMDVTEIPDLTRIKPMDAYSALGWLARENKIEAMMPMPKEYQIKFK